MTLIRAELARIAHRRITKAALILAAAGVTATGAVTFLTHTSETPDWAAATLSAEQNTASCVRSFTEDSSGLSQEAIADMCVSDPAWFVEDRNFHLQSMLAGNGSESFDVVREQAMARSDYPELNAPSSAGGYQGTLAGLAILLTLSAAVLGASYVGADWRSGVIESQLVRQPNPAKLFTAKFAAIAATTGLMAMMTSVAIVLAVIPSALWRGDAANTGIEFWLAVGAMVGRVGIGAALFASIGAGFAMIARNTAAGVGVGFAAFIVGGLATAISGSWTRFVTLPNNLIAWVAQGDVGYLFTSDNGGGVEYYTLMGHTWLAAGALIAAAAAATIVVGASTFAQRDVS